MTGVNPATSGRVSFLEQDITRRSAGQIHRLGISRTFQHVHLLPELTLLENTMMGGYARPGRRAAQHASPGTGRGGGAAARGSETASAGRSG
ncbi:hypothetical protein ACFSC4_23025 [Deinococcus malanensis]|uniref:hypothetical protein n=1 Tax=Deinococcus malanensis TaxID=1706855 RepID=UPI0036437844